MNLKITNLLSMFRLRSKGLVAGRAQHSTQIEKDIRKNFDRSPDG
jgi:hypothetical protein